jgi:short subunit dehydrogenase-like uncharacterized protein
MYDLIVFGATGFTGRLVSEYLIELNAQGIKLNWAMAGRNLGKLKQIHRELQASEQVGLLLANTDQFEEVEQLVQQAKVIISTVGPYQLYGENLLQACAKHGTDYLDLCGEPLWMARMIPIVENQARLSGARLIFSSGFDSIPFDLGVVYLQEQALVTWGHYFKHVSGRVKSMKGTFSGGTVASMLTTMSQIGKNTTLLKKMKGAFLLTPEFEGPKQVPSHVVKYDESLSNWCTPFVMAPINIKNVHRTNFLLHHLWGQEFQYDEMLMTGPGEKGQVKAKKIFKNDRLQQALLYFVPTRWILSQFVLPKPGQGPNQEQRDQGSFEILFHGNRDKEILIASIQGFQDPGYGCTSKMITQSALCLLEDFPKEQLKGGVWTPGSAMGMTLVQRLQRFKVLRFGIQSTT